jgi:hypothetical protein
LPGYSKPVVQKTRVETKDVQEIKLFADCRYRNTPGKKTVIGIHLKENDSAGIVKPKKNHWF